MMESPVHEVPSTPYLRGSRFSDNPGTPCTDAVVPEWTGDQSPEAAQHYGVPGTPATPGLPCQTPQRSLCFTPGAGDRMKRVQVQQESQTSPFKTPTRRKTVAYAPSPADHLVPRTPTTNPAGSTLQGKGSNLTPASPYASPADFTSGVRRSNLVHIPTTPDPNATVFTPRRRGPKLLPKSFQRHSYTQSPLVDGIFRGNSPNPGPSCESKRDVTRRRMENCTKVVKKKRSPDNAVPSRRALTELRRSPETNNVSGDQDKSPDLLDLI